MNQAKGTTDADFLKTTPNYIDNAAAIIIVLKEGGWVHFINKAGCELLGYARNEIIGANWFEKFLPEEASGVASNCLQSYFNRKSNIKKLHENGVRIKSGEIRYIKWAFNYLEDESGNIEGILGSGLDVTEMKAMQLLFAQQEVGRRKQLLTAVLDAQEAERQHISKELHDNVGQLLTTCKLMLDVEMDKGGSPLLCSAFANLQQAINQIRSMSHELDPSQLKEIGLIPSLKELTKTLRKSGRYKVGLTIRGVYYLKKLDHAIGLSVYRMIQEQLNNIIKHAKASEIHMTIIGSKHTLDFEVSDNGIGFDLKKHVKGLGLKNLYNRAELYQGSVYISSAPGEGTLISVCFPLKHS